VPLSDGRPVPLGHTDPERLACGELVYTGVRRTPVCAVLGLDGVTAEFFATVHDAYLLLGLCPEDPADTDTADGRPATRRYALARLARMLGGDVEITPATKVQRLAERIFARQSEAVFDALTAVAGRLPAPPRALVVAGTGEVLARAVISDWCQVFAPAPAVVPLAERLGRECSAAACAYAVAVLAAEGAA
jgi:uncharacterized hydantoinase/oxoprolinase family protein